MCHLERFSPQDHLKKRNFGHLRNLSPPSEKVKKVDLRGQKGSMQWKDSKDVLVCLKANEGLTFVYFFFREKEGPSVDMDNVKI
jgi:hypothetical protein